MFVLVLCLWEPDAHGSRWLVPLPLLSFWMCCGNVAVGAGALPAPAPCRPLFSAPVGRARSLHPWLWVSECFVVELLDPRISPIQEVDYSSANKKEMKLLASKILPLAKSRTIDPATSKPIKLSSTCFLKCPQFFYWSLCFQGPSQLLPYPMSLPCSLRENDREYRIAFV